MSPRTSWTEDRDALLRQSYPRASWAELLAIFDGATKSAIFHRASRLGIDREERDIAPEAREMWRARGLTGDLRRGKFVHPIVIVDGVEGKVCAECETFRPIEKFARHADCAGGRRATCTTCEGRLAYASNPKRVIANVMVYQKRHPARTKMIKFAARRLRNERILVGPGVTVVQLEKLWMEHNGLCAYCGAKAACNDHVIPLSRGGRHEIGNLVPACTPCNSAKHDKTPEEWQTSKESNCGIHKAIF